MAFSRVQFTERRPVFCEQLNNSDLFIIPFFFQLPINQYTANADGQIDKRGNVHIKSSRSIYFQWSKTASLAAIWQGANRENL